MCLPSTPTAPPPPPPPIPVEQLVAKKAETVKPAVSKAKKKRTKDRFNLNRVTKTTVGGLNRTKASVLNLPRK